MVVTALDLDVNSGSESGLLGIALHPNFAQNKFVYLYWTESTTEQDTTVLSETTLLGNRVDRFVWNGASGYGSAESYLGMLAATLGSHDRAHEHFAAASARHERQRARVWEAQNLCYWARSRVQAGSAGEGRSMAERALELARVNGYGLSARRAARLVDVAATA